MNKQAAIEWLNKAWHHFSSGKLLYEAHHYTDVIGIDLHYAVEVTLKALLAYDNKKIKKTHNLLEIHSYLTDKIDFSSEELDLMDRISTYHIKGSYPIQDRQMPSRDELKEVLEFSDELFHRVCKILDIDEKVVKV